ncbi:hypothetical protein [Nocardioides sp. CFH 31398]|uniref:hypothetical protein n=1 Tax=Nocardioides sp. CFH 31398 TaxID=2919579 RepID=UPI001F06D74D|nr:hypothetical protein [Nocardioides sp. CFH 31398]MCH1868006.1 hypothetical protein [Nocardioides sp. CFH 31398]
MDGDPGVHTRFSRALTGAIERSGLSLLGIQARLAERAVPVSVGALSYWRSGQRRPEGPLSRQVVDELESVLGLATGELSRWLGPSRRSGPVRERTSYDELLDVPALTGPVAEHLGSLGLLDSQDRLVEVSVHSTVDVDCDREMTHQASRFLFRAVRAQVATLPILLTNDGMPFPEAPRLLSLRGGRVGRSILDLSAGVAVWEVLLPRPLDVGETVVVEHDLALPRLGEGTEALRYEQYLVRSVRDVLLWVRFDPECLPSSCETYQRQAGHAEEVRSVDVDPGGGLHHTAAGIGPGAFGVRWTW